MARDDQVAVVADESALCGAGILHSMDSLGFSKIDVQELQGARRPRRTIWIASRTGGYPVRPSGNEADQRPSSAVRDRPAVPILITADRCDRDTTLEVLGEAMASSRGAAHRRTGTRDAGNSRGQVFVPPMPAGRSDAEPAQAGSNHPAVLTARQKEVLNLLAAGKSNKQIAWALGISEGTVKVHVNAAFRALGVHNRVNATTALLGRPIWLVSDLSKV